MHDWPGEVRRRLKRRGEADSVDESVVEELAQHVEDRYTELRAAGAAHESALAEALEELTDDELLGVELADVRRSRPAPPPVGAGEGAVGPVEKVWTDLRYGVRLAMRQPGYTAAIVLTLALGIGATTAIFSVVNAILLREPPFAAIDELVMVWETDQASETAHEPASWPDIVDFRERSRTLADVAALQAVRPTWLRDDAESERLNGVAVTGNLPVLLGLRPIVGTTLDEARIAAGERLVLLGEHIWRSRLGADPAIIGSSLRLDGQSATVVGVLPSEADLGMNQIHGRADYGGPFTGRRVDVWIGMAPSAAEFPRWNHPFLAVGRLSPGVSIEAAQQELGAIAAELEAAYPENAARGVNLEALPEVIFGPTRPALLVLLATVGLLLLITCANVANLMMARMVGRRRELSVRTALGARGGRIASQLLMETLVMTTLGAIGGLLLAYGGIRSIVAIAPESIPRIDEVTLDWNVLALLAGVTIAITLVLGVLPTSRAWAADLRGSLQGTAGGRSPEGGGGRATRGVLVVSQAALAVALMIGAGILLRSFLALLAVDPGFETDRVIKAEFQLPPSRYAMDPSRPETFAPATDFYARSLAGVRAIPGVEEAAIAVDHPLQAGFTNSFVIVGREAESEAFGEIRTRFVTPGYQETLGIPVVAGRPLADSDDVEAPRVGVLNRAAAERYFPGRDPLGQELRFWGMPWRVVGVMGDERFLGVDRESEPAIYVSLQQMPIGGGSLLVRTEADPATVVPAMRAAVQEVDGEIVLAAVETLEETLAATVGRPRFTTLLIGMFAVLAVLIALVGLHGLLSYSVSQRAPELGIRKALGASEADLRRLVLGEGLRLTAVGVLIGAALAVAGSRLLESLVFGVSSADPYTFAIVGLVTFLAAMLASWVPARRASSSDPMTALRAE